MPKTRRKILCVDDNPVSQRMSEKIFRQDGYEVFLAWDEESCLKMAVELNPDIILMDIIFPESNGREIVKKLTAHPATTVIPVIFATNTINVEDDKGNESIILEGRTYRAFAKPLHYPKLLSAVRKEINRQV